MIDNKIQDDFYWPDCFPEKKNTVFLDIETTGLSSHNAGIYLIGMAVYDGSCWHIIQLFAKRMTDEQEILKKASEIINAADAIVTFNGNTFDIPFIESSLKQYYLPEITVNRSIDLFKTFKPLKNLLGMERLKQCCFEERIGIGRDNDKPGGELIKVYQEYVKHPNEEAEKELLYHNYCDMLGMLKLTEIFAISSMIRTAVRKEVHIGEVTLRLILKSEHSLSFKVEYKSEDFSLNINGSEIIIEVPVKDNRTKFYYGNYKDYFYLPIEDRAIHKSLGSFVESGYRQKAKRENCYSYEKVDVIISETGLPKYLQSITERFISI